MQDFKPYLTAELNKLDKAETLKIQVRDNAGAYTNWITLPGISTAELLELLSPAELTLFEKVKAAGIEYSNHYSDLYIPVNATTYRLINAYEFKCNVTTFKSQIDGAQWFDIPFAYPDL